ncbi:metallophosphoesterase [uncultured Lutibacter sp.]|uniref:metallophosphoesterase n=1 Tax=uncultured Lutibacter sp. TaxID=437739 RepID=UPI002601D9DC|nr:metallophosphoesterase [uncultured Lutibacter sp.]
MIKKLLFLVSLFVSTINIAQVTIDFEDFESGDLSLTNWTCGGGDCSIANDNYTVKLTSGGSPDQYAIFSDSYDLSAYASVDVTFDFVTSDYSGTDDFYLEYTIDDGANWTKVPTTNGFDVNVDFTDGVAECSKKVTISGPFTTTTSFKFRSSANGDNANIVYLDNIIIEGIGASTVIIDSEDFDGGDLSLTNWTCGVGNCSLANDNYTVKLTSGGSPDQYAIFSDSYDLSAYESVDVTFDFVTSDYSGTDDFYLEYTIDDGANWTKVPTTNGFDVNVDFTDGVAECSKKVTILGPFTATTSFKFRSSANDDVNNIVNIDNIKIEANGSVSPTEGILAGADWYYLDDGSNQGTAWRANGFVDSSWSSGPALLGFGTINDEEEAVAVNTVLGYGADEDDKYRTYYFRKEFTIADKSLYNSIDLEAVRDDGMVVYLNGVEVWRDNITGTVDYLTFADNSMNDENESDWIVKNIASTLLVNGTNTIAVEIHQINATSSDLSFNFKLTPSTAMVGAATVDRGPYLQLGTPTSVIVKWRTTTATDSKVNYGTALGSLNSSESNEALTTDHEITLSNLSPSTIYYYEIANASNILVPQESELYVKTSPVHGTKQFVRFWALGDAGTNGQSAYGTQAKDVRDAYYNYVNGTAISPRPVASSNIGQTDMMLFLGDNAYDNGTDAEFQRAFFEVYPTMLKNTVAWSTRGNHERDKALYYQMYANPTAGEAIISGGGVASGSEEYFSFDYANIHFIVLESYDLENDATQHAWLEADIAATNQDWIIAFFHHPPYTRGTHNSESEQDLIDVRANFVNRLEAGGVDLILNGHSHAYERSYFLHGHTGNMASFNSSTHTVGLNGDGDGKLDGNGAYKRIASNPEDGAVYVVTGSAGKTGTFINGGVAGTNNLDHPAMYTSQNQLGSSVVEIEDDGSGGQNLHLKFLSDTGAVDDYFTINKSSTELSTLSTNTYEVDNKLIKLFPVPANSFINVHINTDESLQKVEFYNVVGNLVKVSKEKTINVRTLNTGMYMVQIITNKTRYYKSIIIE